MSDFENRVYEATEKIMSSLSEMLEMAEATHYDPSGSEEEDANAWEDALEYLKKAETIIKKTY